ncbi:MAG: hypothetical protein AB7U85_06050 [Alphaproteobacteria bacterium]
MLKILQNKWFKIGVIFILLLLSIIRPYLKNLEFLSLLTFPFSLFLFRSLFLLGSFLDKTLPYDRFIIGWVGFYISIIFALVFLFYLYKFLKLKSWKNYQKQAIFFFSFFQLIKISTFIYLVLKMRSSPWRGLFMIILPPYYASFIVPVIYLYNIFMLVRDKDKSISLSLAAFFMFILAI